MIRVEKVTNTETTVTRKYAVEYRDCAHPRRGFKTYIRNVDLPTAKAVARMLKTDPVLCDIYLAKSTFVRIVETSITKTVRTIVEY